ncbi:hypothetical protein GGS21DRAFT_490407 [Xylaria nigripes]|nr:hypothetical protein GGS21DRAFT_490407 [Xylaria nigripes]
MDYAMHHSNHHHLPHHHPSGSSASASAARCPALRAAAEQRNYQLPTISPARGAAQYDPVHSHIGSRNGWQSRSTQAWRPSLMSSPFAQDTLGGNFSGLTSAAQTSQPEHPCPLANIPHAQNAPESYAPPMLPYQQFRPTMHPVPRLLGQPAPQSPGGYASSNPNQLNALHLSNRSAYAADTALPASVHSGPMGSVTTSGASANSVLGQTASFSNENTNPSGPQLPHIPHILAHQNHSVPFSQQTPQPITQTAASVEANSSRLASNSFSPTSSTPASTAPQRTNDQTNRMVSSVEIRRASSAAINRTRRSMARFTATPSDWIGENAIMLRRDVNLMEFMENYPGLLSDGETTMNAHRLLRGNGPGKRVASKQALASLQSVNITDLPEGERTCVICYNDFGVANPEGINEAPLRLPKCRHVFGDHCIKKWFQESDSCPYCRDQVHSEFQPMPSRRAHSSFRFITPYHISPQHLPGFQGYDDQPRDRDTSESETSPQPELSSPDNTTDGSSNLSSDAGSSTRSPSGRRFENSHHHSMRMPSWNAALERRSPPAEYDRRRRTRHRARISPSSTRTSIFGGPGPNVASQTSVRFSRSSRSRSPFDPMSTGVDLGSRRSLTNNPQQYHGNDSLSPNSNHRGGPTTSGPPGAPVFEESSFPLHLQVQLQMQSGTPLDDIHELLRPNVNASPANEQWSASQRRHFERSRFTPPSIDVPLDDFAATSDRNSSNQFTSYQQS